ncbi:DinB family protein [Alicyclobacillus mengziensis]|uniref:DinB family protein n=1 Tax=Alicyclobacillus mengziensis TaxID=2931921 RepID=A0A9X7VUW3_9BACL|nr:DinB family protein [Alicyclobacillus mengziensis]QSO45639.1 DinB family protein [Alicyclobacillus mengziensis]
MNTVLETYNYHAWGNKMLLDRLKQLPSEVFHREIKSAFPSISSVIAHVYTVDQLWSYIISGMDMPEALDVEKASGEGKNIDEIDGMFHTLSEAYKETLAQSANRHELRWLNIPWEGKRETSLYEMVLHVVTHGTYHRGNVTAMLHQMGYTSITTDMTAYWFV